MSKPIFIIKLPYAHSDMQQLSEINDIGTKKMPDYHVMAIGCAVEDVTFECYNTTDLDAKSFKELKELVNELV